MANTNQSEMKWIRVEERMPDIPSGYVLIHTKSGLTASDFYCRDEVFFGRNVAEGRSRHFEHGAKWGHEITHWMPLPLPPAPQES